MHPVYFGPAICMVTNGYRTDTSHVLIILMCCILHSGPHLDSSAVCWLWIQILLSRERIWLVSMNYIFVTDKKFTENIIYL